MEHFRIKPNIGVGLIKFGMTKTEVESFFWTPPNLANGNRLCYFSGFMIDFDTLNAVVFIALAKSDLFRGVDLLCSSASKVVSFVSNHDYYDLNDPELGYSYVFKSLQLSLWRGSLPEDENANDGEFFEAGVVGCSSYFE